jgi:ribose transport system permease protein
LALAQINLSAVMEQAGPFLGLLLVAGLFALSSEVRPYLFTGGNFKIILTQTVIVAIGALGMTMIIVSGGIDLSAGSVVAFTSVLGATLLLKGFSTATTIALVALAAGLIGSINGSLIARFRMMPFIVTLGTMSIVRGSAKWLAEIKRSSAHRRPVNQIMALKNPDAAFSAATGCLDRHRIGIVVSFIMRRLVFGRYMFAVGANETTARFSGINILRHKIMVYAFAGLFFGLAGVMQLSRLTQGDPTVAVGLELDIIAAVVIGGASLNGRIRQRARLDDRRAHHGGFAQRIQPDGLGELRAGDYHRRRYRTGGGHRPAAPAASELQLTGKSGKIGLIEAVTVQ